MDLSFKTAILIAGWLASARSQPSTAAIFAFAIDKTSTLILKPKTITEQGFENVQVKS
jgi:hypothetical protein